MRPLPSNSNTFFEEYDADDSTLMAVVPSPGARVTVAESLNSDLRVNACVTFGG